MDYNPLLSLCYHLNCPTFGQASQSCIFLTSPIMFAYFLVKQNVPGLICTFPAPAMESAFFLKDLWFFTVENGITWHIVIEWVDEWKSAFPVGLMNHCRDIKNHQLILPERWIYQNRACNPLLSVGHSSSIPNSFLPTHAFTLHNKMSAEKHLIVLGNSESTGERELL